jgi:flagellar basal-body rod protein FlgB
MSIIERAFSIHDDALMLRSQRAGILAANIANADTPNYKARDMDFPAMLERMQQGDESGFGLKRTHERHIAAEEPMFEGMIKYRNPMAPALDGNTVDMQMEQARFAENALQYQTSLTFLNGKIRSLKLAIKGQ